MPRKKTDDSFPRLAFDRRPWKPINKDRLRSLASQFEIADEIEFANQVHDWSCNYRSAREMFRDLPSLPDQRDMYLDVANKLDAAGEAFKNLGPATLAKLSYAADSYDSEENALSAIAMMQHNQSWEKVGMMFPDSFDIIAWQSDMMKLRDAASTLHRRIATGLRNDDPIVMDYKTLDIETLVSQIRKYFRHEFPAEPLGRSFDPNGEHGPAGQTPTNTYSDFTLECARLVDPTLSNHAIQEAMSVVIRKENR